MFDYCLARIKFMCHFGVAIDHLISVEFRTMIFEDAQVEAWHDTPDLSIETGGAFHSEGPLNLTRSNLTAPWTTGRD